jgi:ribosomal protein S18 acetylase RimI-like enzyme
MNARVTLAEDREQVARCFAVMRELRTDLADQDSFVSQVLRQQKQGYRLACVEADGEIRAAAGFRILENLAWGRFLYVDDLVTRAADRSLGWGRMLFDWLTAEARMEGCGQLHLDSGVQRFDAHRFYLAQRMQISSHHFALKLT